MGDWGKIAQMIVHEDDPYNAEPPPEALAGAQLTPVDVFYGRNHGDIPDIDARAWRLEVAGLVDLPGRWSLRELQDRFPLRRVVATLQCAGARRAGLAAVREIPGETPWGSGAISTAEWGGVRLRDVLDAAGVQDSATDVSFWAPDVSRIPEPPESYGSSIPLRKALGEEVLLAWEMNGEPLPRVHGGPVRVLVPGFIGARSVKWVTGITVTDEPSDNYFQRSAYRLLPAEADPERAGPGEGLMLSSVALNCDFLTPADGSHHPAGPLRVAGYAFAGDDREIARVDVSRDGGTTWRQARLEDHRSPWDWTLWHIDIELPVGRTELVVRAWDTTGATQPEDPGPLWNPKGYINSAWGRLAIHGGGS